MRPILLTIVGLVVSVLFVAAVLVQFSAAPALIADLQPGTTLHTKRSEFRRGMSPERTNRETWAQFGAPVADGTLSITALRTDVTAPGGALLQRVIQQGAARTEIAPGRTPQTVTVTGTTYNANDEIREMIGRLGTPATSSTGAFGGRPTTVADFRQASIPDAVVRSPALAGLKAVGSTTRIEYVAADFTLISRSIIVRLEGGQDMLVLEEKTTVYETLSSVPANLFTP